MNTPRYKDPSRDAPRDPTSGAKGTLVGMLQSLLRIDTILSSGLPVRYLPRLLWVTVLIIFYIANSHNANRTLVKIDRINTTIEERRVDYTTLKADYMSASKQSEVAKRVQPLGLYESQVPPRKIVLEEAD